MTSRIIVAGVAAVAIAFGGVAPALAKEPIKIGKGDGGNGGGKPIKIGKGGNGGGNKRPPVVVGNNGKGGGKGGGKHHHGGGNNAGAAIAVGAAALVAGALIASSAEARECWYETETVWDPRYDAYVVARVRVCD